MKVLDLTSGAGIASSLRLEVGRESTGWSGAQQAAAHPSSATRQQILQEADPFSEPHFPHLENGAKSNVSSEADGRS